MQELDIRSLIGDYVISIYAASDILLHAMHLARFCKACQSTAGRSGAYILRKQFRNAFSASEIHQLRRLGATALLSVPAIRGTRRSLVDALWPIAGVTG